MKKIIFLFLIGFLFSNCNTYKKYQDYPNEPELYPIGAEGKWGYVDGEGIEKIPLDFEAAQLFKYGLAAVKQNGKYGYLNLEGAWEIKPKFEKAGDFYFGCTEVEKDGAKIYINRKGKPIKYSDCEQSGIVVGCIEPRPAVDPMKYSVQKGDKWALTYKQTKDTSDYIFDSVTKFDQEFILVEKEGKFGFHYFDMPPVVDGKVYHSMELKFIYEEVAVKYQLWNDEIENGNIVFAEVKKEGFWGLINSRLIEVVEPKYLSMERTLSEKLIKVEYEKNKFGCIDYFGNEYFRRRGEVH